MSSYIWGSLFSLSALDTAMTRRSTVSSIQERWTVVSMSGMSAFRRCTNLSRVSAQEHSRATRGSPLYGPYMVRTGFRGLFASETGEPLDRRVVTKLKFKPLLKRAGLPEIRFHDLRHTCATLLLTRNVNPKIVSEMLGHSTIAITLDTYSHVLLNMRNQAAAAMKEALS